MIVTVGVALGRLFGASMLGKQASRQEIIIVSFDDCSRASAFMDMSVSTFVSSLIFRSL